MISTVRGRCPHCGPEFPRQPCAQGPDYEYRTTGAQEFTFVRCGSCGTLVLDPRPSDADIPALYPPSYEPYHFAELPAPVRWGRELVQYRKVRALLRWASAGATIVDVGCGAGATLRLLRKFGAPDLRLIGWDFPGAHLERLAADGFEVISAPIEARHAPARADVFILNQVLEHFAEPDALLTALHQALSPGGVIFIETPDTRGLDAGWFGRRHWGGYHFPRHLVLFDGQGLRQLLEQKGFHVLQSARLPSPAFWIQSLHHSSEPRFPWLARMCTLRNLPLVALFTAFDLLVAPFHPTSNQRLIAVRT